MKYTPKWDLATIPVPALAEDVPYDNLQEAAAMAKAARGPGRPKLPRCGKCGEIKRSVHECSNSETRTETKVNRKKRL